MSDSSDGLRPQLQFSKLDAARRQMETAITLYFLEGDPVSIHSLTAASYAVLRDLNAHRGGAPMFTKEGSLDHIKPESRKEYIRLVNEAENFFKHADRDPNETLTFDPGQSEVLLFDCCMKYRELTGEVLPLATLFQGWSRLTWARPFIDDSEFQRQAADIEKSLPHNFNRRQFFIKFLPITYGSAAPFSTGQP